LLHKLYVEGEKTKGRSKQVIELSTDGLRKEFFPERANHEYNRHNNVFRRKFNMYKIGRNIFKTQKEIKSYYSNILKSVYPCNDLKNKYPEYFLDFKELFKRHPDNKANGMTNIKIQYCKENRFIVPWIQINNKWDTISVNCCINGKSKNNLKEAMRTAIEQQIKIFRNSNAPICQICKKHCTLDDIHIDHVNFFANIADTFLRANPLHPTTFTSNKINRVIFKPEDENFEKKWYEYHLQNASLRVLCKNCNLSRGYSSLNQ